MTIENEELLMSEGAKYFPRIFKRDGRYSISKRQKGTHELGVVLRELRNRKIQKIAYSYVGDNHYVSRNSCSCYFNYKGTEYRVSDHHSNSFIGTQIIINWKTDIDPILNLKNQ